jgi:hypothetical protein
MRGSCDVSGPSDEGSACCSIGVKWVGITVMFSGGCFYIFGKLQRKMEEGGERK